MRLQGRLIIILFVEHKHTWVLRRAVEDIRTVARLLPHFGDRNAQDALKLLFLISLYGQCGGKSEPPTLLCATVIKVCDGNLRTPLNGKRIAHTDRLRSEGVRDAIRRCRNPEFSPSLHVLVFDT